MTQIGFRYRVEVRHSCDNHMPDIFRNDPHFRHPDVCSIGVLQSGSGQAIQV